jgi:hypothetical protein
MLINIRRAFPAIVSICNLGVSLSKITPRYITWFTKGTCRPFNARNASTGLRRWEK